MYICKQILEMLDAYYNCEPWLHRCFFLEVGRKYSKKHFTVILVIFGWLKNDNDRESRPHKIMKLD